MKTIHTDPTLGRWPEHEAGTRDDCSMCHPLTGANTSRAWHRGGCLVDVGCHDDHMCLCGVGDAPPQPTPAQLIERGVILSRRMTRGDRIDPVDAHIIDDLIALYRVVLGNPASVTRPSLEPSAPSK